MRQRLRWALSFTPLEILTLAHAFVWLATVEVLVRRAPISEVGRWLGVPLDLDSGPAPATGCEPPELPDRAERQLWAAWALAERWPYSDGPCLRRTLVAGRLIRRHNPTLRLGVAPRDGGVFAHAWLEIDGRPLEDLDDLQVFRRHPPTGGT